MYSFCTLYDGDLINYNISANRNDITPTSIGNTELSNSGILQGTISSTLLPSYSSLELISFLSNVHTSKLPLTSFAQVNIKETSFTSLHLLSTTEMHLHSTAGHQPSQLLIPSTSIKPSHSSQKVLLKTQITSSQHFLPH